MTAAMMRGPVAAKHGNALEFGPGCIVLVVGGAQHSARHLQASTDHVDWVQDRLRDTASRRPRQHLFLRYPRYIQSYGQGRIAAPPRIRGGESWPRTWLVRVSATEAAAALATMMPLLNASCICSLNINYFSVICETNYSLHDLLKGIALTIVTILRRE